MWVDPTHKDTPLTRSLMEIWIRIAWILSNSLFLYHIYIQIQIERDWSNTYPNLLSIWIWIEILSPISQKAIYRHEKYQLIELLSINHLHSTRSTILHHHPLHPGCPSLPLDLEEWIMCDWSLVDNHRSPHQCLIQADIVLIAFVATNSYRFVLPLHLQPTFVS